jgi:hypothetical protein
MVAYMEISQALIATKQYILDDLRNEGDNLNVEHEVAWIFRFLDDEHAQQFRDAGTTAFPFLTFHSQNCECNCIGKIVPTAIELARIEQSLGEISMQIANRTELNGSITSALALRPPEI